MEETPNTLDPITVDAALRDLEARTLAKLDGDFARLVYLASTRDYNSGHYEHSGLGFHFSKPVAEEALETAHRGVFESLALSSLEAMVGQLERYIRSGSVEAVELLTTWQDLEAYRILVPTQDDALTVKLFISNIKIALAIVEPSWRKSRSDQDPQFASQLPSPDQ